MRYLISYVITEESKSFLGIFEWKSKCFTAHFCILDFVLRNPLTLYPKIIFARWSHKWRAQNRIVPTIMRVTKKNKDKNVSIGLAGKRRRGGRPKIWVEEFAIFYEGNVKRARCMCWNDTMRPIVWNSRRALNLFLNCKTIRSRNPSGNEKLLWKHHGPESAEAEKQRRFRESILISPKRGIEMTTSHSFNNKEKLYQYNGAVSSKKKDKSDCAWADAISITACRLQLGNRTIGISFSKLGLVEHGSLHISRKYLVPF